VATRAPLLCGGGDLLSFTAVGIFSPSRWWGSPLLRGGSGRRMDARSENLIDLNRDGGEEGGLAQLTLNALKHSARGMDALWVTLPVAHGGGMRYA
jgi:hypothetical protein